MCPRNTRFNEQKVLSEDAAQERGWHWGEGGRKGHPGRWSVCLPTSGQPAEPSLAKVKFWSLLGFWVEANLHKRINYVGVGILQHSFLFFRKGTGNIQVQDGRTSVGAFQLSGGLVWGPPSPAFFIREGSPGCCCSSRSRAGGQEPFLSNATVLRPMNSFHWQRLQVPPRVLWILWSLKGSAGLVLSRCR